MNSPCNPSKINRFRTTSKDLSKAKNTITLDHNLLCNSSVSKKYISTLNLDLLQIINAQIRKSFPFTSITYLIDNIFGINI